MFVRNKVSLACCKMYFCRPRISPNWWQLGLRSKPHWHSLQHSPDFLPRFRGRPQKWEEKRRKGKGKGNWKGEKKKRNEWWKLTLRTWTEMPLDIIMYYLETLMEILLLSNMTIGRPMHDIWCHTFQYQASQHTSNTGVFYHHVTITMIVWNKII